MGEEADFYALVAEGIPNMVWTAGPDGQLDYFNTRVFEYTGLTAAELRGWNWKGVIHPEDRAACEERWRQSLVSGEPYAIEARIRRGSDATYRWHLRAARPLRKPDGSIARWIGTSTDIEDRKREHIEPYMSLVSLSPDAIVIRRGEKLVFVNQSAAHLLGARSTQDLNGTRLLDLVHPDDLALCRERMKRYDDYGEVLPPAEMRLRRNDGTFVTIEASGASIKLDGRKATQTIWRDLTESKRAEQALREREFELNEAQRLAQLGSWVWEAATDTVTWTEEIYRVYRCDPASGPVRYSEHSALFTVESWSRLQTSVATALRHGVAYELELELAGTDRNGRWVHARGEAVRNESGAVVGLRGTLQDITNQRNAQEELRQYSDRFKQLHYRLVDMQEAERRNLASTLHDLVGQKLTALNIGLNILKRELHDTAGPHVHSRLESLATIVDETVYTIRDVMEDLHPPELEAFGLMPALHSHANRFKEQTGIATTVKAVEPYGRLPRNVELALFRIAQEALTNAVKHSGAATIRIRAWQEDGHAFLAIEDDGRGFTDPTGARSVWRGGWGLPEMRKRAEAIGGQLKIEFPDTGGTRVLVQVATRHAD